MLVPLTTLLAVKVAIALCDRDRREIEAMLPDGISLDRWACEAACAPLAEAFAVLVDDEPVAMGGLRRAGQAWLASAWYVGTDRKLEAGWELFAHAKRHHDEWRARGVRKFQATCLLEGAADGEFMHRLGYHREAIVRGLGKNGEDFVQWGSP